MIALIQRVTSAQVEVAQEVIGSINRGILLFLGIDRSDNHIQADRLLQRVLNYRLFADAQQRMNLNLQDIHGQLLIVSQFTLVADTRKGNRPSFTNAAPPAIAYERYTYFIQQARHRLGEDRVATGSFGADMQVKLINDGPVTFWLEA